LAKTSLSRAPVSPLSVVGLTTSLGVFLKFRDAQSPTTDSGEIGARDNEVLANPLFF